MPHIPPLTGGVEHHDTALADCESPFVELRK